MRENSGLIQMKWDGSKYEIQKNILFDYAVRENFKLNIMFEQNVCRAILD